ncbi:MAG: glycosyltransferase [Geobacteraceae bacterium]|nr:glycosyltransferase [Geobacteraceae bacterium]NTW79394.1 glycosyltransferase [Geobacteraceae bacterium]
MNTIKKPHLLFFSAKWHDCKPENGESNAESILWGPFSTTGLGTYDCFLSDEHYLATNMSCDEALLEKCRNDKPDILVLAWMPSAPDYINPQLSTLGIIRNILNIPIVAIWYDTWADWVPALVDTVTPFVDFSIIADSLSHFEKSPYKDKYIHLFHPADVRVFHDLEILRDINISFNGGINGLSDRIAGMNALRAAGIDVLKTGGQMESPLSTEDYARMFMRSKISLNFSLSGQNLTLKGRLLEATLCGSMLLESCNSETSKWFEPMIEYVPFVNENDLVEKARYYLTNDAEREAIALRGREKARKIGDGKAFWGKIISEIESLWPPINNKSMYTMNSQESTPLISIFTICKNGGKTIRRCFDSILELSKNYPNIEFIIQDGVSTDGTLEIISEYAPLFGTRIKLISEPDRCPEEGFWRAIKRCTGDIICSCFSDEQIMPNAASVAVEAFKMHPDAAALFGWICTTDENGVTIGIDQGPVSFNLDKYISGEITPHFSSSFFRRSCLEQIGLYSRNWQFGVGEFELWTRLGLHYSIVPIPSVMSKYARHTGSLSSGVKNISALTEARLNFISGLFEEPGTPDYLKNMRSQTFAGQYIHAAWHYLAFEINSPEEARKAILEALKYQPHPEHHLYPSFVTKLYDYGFELCNKGEFERALDFLTLVDNTGIYATNIYFYRSLALSKLGRYSEARRAIEKELSYNRNPDVIGLMQLIDSKLNTSALSKYELLLKNKADMLERIVSERNNP